MVWACVILNVNENSLVNTQLKTRAQTVFKGHNKREKRIFELNKNNEQYKHKNTEG